MNKETLISIEMYFDWVLCNVLWCVLPIGIIWLIGALNRDLDLTVVFSSILIFLFTLMVTSIYTFYPFARWKSMFIGGDILFSFSLSVIFAILVFFVLYNVMPRLQQIMNDNMYYWGFLLLALAPAIQLNRPAIEDRIEKKRSAVKVAEAFRKGKKKREKWLDSITGGGRG